MMKKLAIPIFCILAVGIVIFGKMHYDNKLASIKENASNHQLLDSNVSKVMDKELLELTNNMNNELRDLFIRKFESEETLSILVIGSDATFTSEDDDLPWPFQFIEAIEENYVGAYFHLETMNLEDISTHQLIETNAHYQAASFQPDVMIVEPLLLNDNGIVKIDDTIQNINILLDTVKESSPEVFILLQPPNPIFQATVYLEQVNYLKEFALTNRYEYLDHWEAWPEVTDEQLQRVLTGIYPNTIGHELWAGYINDYFVAK
ncbi:MAG: SGNH/GDSL hydrolase family protein [Bacillaceae bacterium]|nr:SGNH/GDSL hydrolase family protein [Bacillaceae bacterium]